MRITYRCKTCHETFSLKNTEKAICPYCEQTDLDITERIDSFDGRPSSVAEAGAKCSVCVSGLSYIENILYGKYCELCAPVKSEMRFIDFIRAAVMDYRIWKLYRKCKDRNLINGCIGFTGVKNYCDMSFRQKREFYRELKRYL